jgi:hypothetical protein
MQSRQREYLFETSMAKLTKYSSSTGVGLAHVRLACEGAGGTFSLRLNNDGWVACSIVLPAQLIPASSAKRSNAQKHVPNAGGAGVKLMCGTSEPEADSDSKPATAGCKMLAIDDSPV